MSQDTQKLHHPPAATDLAQLVAQLVAINSINPDLEADAPGERAITDHVAAPHTEQRRVQGSGFKVQGSFVRLSGFQNPEPRTRTNPAP